MPMITKIQQGGTTYDIGIPSGLTESQQAQIRENIGAISESEAGVVVDGTYPDMTVGEATHALKADDATNATNATDATNATNDSAGNNIAETYAKIADLERLLLDLEYPVGGSKPYIQYPGMETPAERYANTNWVLDTQYEGRVLIGSGGEYVFGATGGSKTHYHELSENTFAAVYIVGDKLDYKYHAGGGEYEYLPNYENTIPNGVSTPIQPAVSRSTGVQVYGNTEYSDNMQPHIVVNFWKRVALEETENENF